MKQETWKPIKGYENYYKISSLGRIKSLDMKVWGGRAYYEKKGRIRRLIKSSNGYLMIALSKEGDKKTFTVHQLMAMTFLNHNIESKSVVVDHINNDKLDNRLSNLQIVSARYNTSKDKKEGTSKYVGVGWDKYANKWKSQIHINKKSKHLGYFSNEFDASLAYKKALIELNE